jgi:hypothetical protein
VVKRLFDEAGTTLSRAPPFRLKRIPSRGGGEFQISNVGAET